MGGGMVAVLAVKLPWSEKQSEFSVALNVYVRVGVGVFF